MPYVHERETSRPVERRGFIPGVPTIASPVGAVLLVVTGFLILVSTFMNWAGGYTGWNLMSAGDLTGRTSNFVFTTVNQGIILSGFWSLLFGILIVVGGAILLFDVNGSNLAMPSAFLGFIIAVFNIIIVYVNEAQFPGGAGGGLWLFAIVALVGLLLGATVIPSETY